MICKISSKFHFGQKYDFWCSVHDEYLCTFFEYVIHSWKLITVYLASFETEAINSHQSGECVGLWKQNWHIRPCYYKLQSDLQGHLLLLLFWQIPLILALLLAFNFFHFSFIFIAGGMDWHFALSFIDIVLTFWTTPSYPKWV